MRTFVILPLFAFAIGFLANPVAAQDYKTLLDIPAGQTLVTLSATERVTVDQDLLTASLRFEDEGSDPRALQDRINETMKKALARAKSYQTVKASTQQYHVYAYDRRPEPSPEPMQRGNKSERSWRGQQSLQLESKDTDQLLKLAGELQDMGLAMSGLSYSVSSDLMQETQESLLEAAVRKLTARAERAARALGKSKADMLSVNIDSGGGTMQPMMMRGMAMADSMAGAPMSAPVAEAGESEISLSVSATALLK